MTTEKTVEEVRTIVFNREPPGDRWKPVDGGLVLDSLTDALELHFQKTGITEYFISAKDGTVSVVEQKEVEVTKPVTRYSLYGED